MAVLALLFHALPRHRIKKSIVVSDALLGHHRDLRVKETGTGSLVIMQK